MSGELVEQPRVRVIEEPGRPALYVIERVVERPAEPVEVVPEPSKTVPWALIAVSLVILLFAVFASWHTWVGPQLDPVRSHPVDLVNPSK